MSKVIVKECVQEVLELAGVDYVQDQILYGADGVLDSISLVMLVASIEERLLDSTGVIVTLVNDRTFSAKSSPFKNETSIVNFIQDLIS